VIPSPLEWPEQIPATEYLGGDASPDRGWESLRIYRHLPQVVTEKFKKDISSLPRFIASTPLKMGSLGASTFRVLDDARPDDTSIPAFMVSKTRGFLPRANPVVTLPSEFDALESILQRMPVKMADGEPGLLAEYKLGDVVDNELPNLESRLFLLGVGLPPRAVPPPLHQRRALRPWTAGSACQYLTAHCQVC